MSNSEPEDGNPEEHDSTGGANSSPASGLIVSVQRIAASTAKSAGYPKLAELIKGWPEFVGSRIGEAIKKLRQKQDNGELITSEDEATLSRAVAAEPEKATQLVGLAYASALEEKDADTEMEEVLSAYDFVFSHIANSMKTRRTSFALKGFLHGSDFASYWHLHSNSPHFSRSEGSITPSSLDVYFLPYEPSTENLCVLNEAIRRDPKRCLPQELYNYRENGAIAKLMYVAEFSVVESRLPPEDKPQMFGRFPTNNQLEIPAGAPNLSHLFDSLQAAQHCQDILRTSLTDQVENIRKLAASAK